MGIFVPDSPPAEFLFEVSPLRVEGLPSLAGVEAVAISWRRPRGGLRGGGVTLQQSRAALNENGIATWENEYLHKLITLEKRGGVFKQRELTFKIQKVGRDSANNSPGEESAETIGKIIVDFARYASMKHTETVLAIPCNFRDSSEQLVFHVKIACACMSAPGTCVWEPQPAGAVANEDGGRTYSSDFERKEQSTRQIAKLNEFLQESEMEDIQDGADPTLVAVGGGPAPDTEEIAALRERLAREEDTLEEMRHDRADREQQLDSMNEDIAWKEQQHAENVAALATAAPKTLNTDSKRTYRGVKAFHAEDENELSIVVGDPYELQDENTKEIDGWLALRSLATGQEGEAPVWSVEVVAGSRQATASAGSKASNIEERNCMVGVKAFRAEEGEELDVSVGAKYYLKEVLDGGWVLVVNADGIEGECPDWSIERDANPDVALFNDGGTTVGLADIDEVDRAEEANAASAAEIEALIGTANNLGVSLQAWSYRKFTHALAAAANEGALLWIFGRPCHSGDGQGRGRQRGAHQRPARSTARARRRERSSMGRRATCSCSGCAPCG